MELELQQQVPKLLDHMWPMFRVGAFLMVLPAIGNDFVPAPARVVLLLGVTLLLAPLVSPPAGIDLFSGAGVLAIVREIGAGLIMGFVLKLVLDAVTLGGQSVAMSMGLGFAVFIDSARGVNVPVLGQFLLLLATLTFLALDGHLNAISMLARSFDALPIAQHGGLGELASQLLVFSSIVFTGAVAVALPAVTALLVVNIAFGVMSRAAPTLNLFAVGFPVSLLFGLIALCLAMDGFSFVLQGLFDDAFVALGLIAGGRTP